MSSTSSKPSVSLPLHLHGYHLLMGVVRARWSSEALQDWCSSRSQLGVRRFSLLLSPAFIGNHLGLPLHDRIYNALALSLKHMIKQPPSPDQPTSGVPVSSASLESCLLQASPVSAVVSSIVVSSSIVSFLYASLALGLVVDQVAAVCSLYLFVVVSTCCRLSSFKGTVVCRPGFPLLPHCLATGASMYCCSSLHLDDCPILYYCLCLLRTGDSSILSGGIC